MTTLAPGFVTVQAAFAHLGHVAGVGYDQSSQLPLRDVAVPLTGKLTLTDELGQFRFTNPVAAPYKLELLRTGFQNQVIMAAVANDQTVFINVTPIGAPTGLDLPQLTGH